MILLTTSGPVRPQRTIVIFGMGLVGSAVALVLRTLIPLNQERMPLSWTDSAAQKRQLEALGSRIRDSLASMTSSYNLTFIWSAGSAGFAATEHDVQPEIDSFQSVLAVAEALADEFPHARTAFHLLSSAGGLFEGQRHVAMTSQPAPVRPYGNLKLQQEHLLAATNAPVRKEIYRLTSVYGYLSRHHRIGLISALVLNGLRQRVTNITGQMGTLRDFVWADDVANFIANALLNDAAESTPKPRILGHGKPSSIFEIKRYVELALRRKIYVNYSLALANSEDITFSPEVFPVEWRSSDLQSTIRRICADAIVTGAAFA